VKTKGGKFEGEGKETTITVEADKEAKPGEYTITVKSGDVTKTFKVEVQKADDGGGDGKKGATYKIDPESVTVKQGEEAKVKITREGGGMKDKELKIEGDKDAKLTGEGKFKEGEKEATLTIKADKAAKEGEHTIKINAGDKEIGTVKVKVEKAKKAMLRNPTRDFALAPSRTIEVVPDFRVSARREVALFTREL
jgi:uncharacterized membrane protein